MIIVRINGEKIKKVYVWIVKLPMDADIFSTGTLHSSHYFNLTIGRQKTSLDCNSRVRMGCYRNWPFFLA